METPQKLLRHLFAITGASCQRKLSMILHCEESTLSRYHHGSITLSPALILRIHEYTGVPVTLIRKLANCPRKDTQ